MQIQGPPLDFKRDVVRFLYLKRPFMRSASTGFSKAFLRTSYVYYSLLSI